MKKIVVFSLLIGFSFLTVSTSSAAISIALCGTSHQSLTNALNTLGYTYTTFGENFPTSGYDAVIVGMDGGTAGWPDMNAYLNSGGHLALFGGSNWLAYSDWVKNYFNIQGYAEGIHWHTSSATPNYVELVDSDIFKYIPDTYNYGYNSCTYHMLHFLTSQPAGTTLLASNGEPNNIAALREYTDDGDFFYFAQDVNQYAQYNDQNFTTNLVKGYLEYVESGGGEPIPEPSSLMLLGTGLLGLLGYGKVRLSKKA